MHPDGTVTKQRWNKPEGRPRKWESQFEGWCLALLAYCKNPDVKPTKAINLYKLGEDCDLDSARRSVQRAARQAWDHARPQLVVIDASQTPVVVMAARLRPHPMMRLDPPHLELTLKKVWRFTEGGPEGGRVDFADSVVIGFASSPPDIQQVSAAALLVDKAFRNGRGAILIDAEGFTAFKLPEWLLPAFEER